MRTPLLQPWDVVPQASQEWVNGKGLSRLLSAAVINQEFCDLLLTEPAAAVTAGYNGEAFQLETDEQELVRSICATSLADFAQQLSQNGNGTSHHYNGNGHSRNSHLLR
jgi:hypothetical protein